MIIYIVISFINVFLHITRSIFVIKSSKFLASLMNCLCYTFSAVVIKFIAETDLYTAIMIQALTNFFGCYAAMWVCEIKGRERGDSIEYDPTIRIKAPETPISTILKNQNKL